MLPIPALGERYARCGAEQAIRSLFSASNVAAYGGCIGNFLALIASMMNLMVQKFMTPLPHTIRDDQSLAAAHQLMRTHDIRHLPVLKDGRLAGVVSQRDLYMIETLKDIDMTQIPVVDAMSTDVYAVGPRTSVRKIAEEMSTALQS